MRNTLAFTSALTIFMSAIVSSADAAPLSAAPVIAAAAIATQGGSTVPAAIGEALPKGDDARVGADTVMTVAGSAVARGTGLSLSLATGDLAGVAEGAATAAALGAVGLGPGVAAAVGVAMAISLNSSQTSDRDTRDDRPAGADKPDVGLYLNTIDKVSDRFKAPDLSSGASFADHGSATLSERHPGEITTGAALSEASSTPAAPAAPAPASKSGPPPARDHDPDFGHSHDDSVLDGIEHIGRGGGHEWSGSEGQESRFSNQA